MLIKICSSLSAAAIRNHIGRTVCGSTPLPEGEGFGRRRDLRMDFCNMAQKSGMAETLRRSDRCGFAGPNVHMDIECLPSVCAYAVASESLMKGWSAEFWGT